MDNLVSVPMTNPSAFLKQRAKASLTQDLTLDKAADLTAQRNALLEDDSIPDGLKRAQLQQLNRQVRTWTQKVRQPFREGSDAGEDTVIKALIKTIKSPEADPPVIPKRRPTKKDASPLAPVAQKKRKDVATQWLDF